MRGAIADLFVADGVGDIFAFQSNPLPVIIGADVELHIQMSGQQLQGFFIRQVDAMVARGERQQTIERSGIEQTPAQMLGQPASNGAFARTARPVDGDDWRSNPHD